jgi:hypothetical protein
MRIENLSFRALLEALKSSGAEARNAMNEQTNAIEELSQDYSHTALNAVMENVQALLGLAKFYETTKQAPETIRSADEDIAEELSEIAWDVQDFSEQIVGAIKAEIAEKAESADAQGLEFLLLCRELLITKHNDYATKIQTLQQSIVSPRVQKQCHALVKSLKQTADELTALPYVSNVWVSEEDLLKAIAILPRSDNTARLHTLEAQKAREQDYSDTKKQLFHLAIFAMLGGSWLSEAMSLSTKGEQLKVRAEQAARQLRDTVPPQVTADASFIGIILADKLEQLRRFDDAQFQAITKRHPDTRATLETFRHSSDSISRQNIHAVMDGYISHQAVKGQASQTIGGWFNTFFTQQGASASSQVAAGPTGWKADLHAQLRRLSPVHLETTAPAIETLTASGLAVDLGNAILSHSMARVTELIDAGASLEMPLIGLDKTPLELAIGVSLDSKTTNSAMVKTLLTNGVTYPRSEWGLAKLIVLAERTGDPELLQLAVNRGLDLTKKTQDGDTTGIELLLSFGGPVMNKWLLGQPPLVDYKNGITGQTVPQMAIERLNSGFLRDYLASGLTLNQEAKQPTVPPTPHF